MSTIDRATRNDLILKLHGDGLSEREIARLVHVSRSTVWAVIRAAKR